MIDIKRKKGESFEAMLRRFNKRVQSSGLMPEVRSRRHHKKDPNKNQRRGGALRRLEIGVKRAYLEKIGMLVEEKKKKFGR